MFLLSIVAGKVFTSKNSPLNGSNMAIKNGGSLSKVTVTPLASESFGVRSMCTLVQTPDVSILLDAGVSLCPYRFNLPPHPIEFQTIARLRQSITEAADKATVTTISHYHFDHHTPSYGDWLVNWTDNGETARQIYQGKIVLAKNPKENINASQRQRAWMFQKTGGKHAKNVTSADGKTFTYGNTKLSFSQAVAHGSDNSMLGWVIMATVECDGERFMHAPDVQGPMSNHTTELILAAKPAVIMLGGPPLYLAGFRVEESQLEQGLRNLEYIVETVPAVVLEHHILRDEFWRSKMEKIFQKAQQAGHSIITAAEWAGKENVFLESKRKQLFKEHPPSEEFVQWTKTLNNKKIEKPPL
jgi:predicted metallo-beta-lactamase superfamily hydrolase